MMLIILCLLSSSLSNYQKTHGKIKEQGGAINVGGRETQFTAASIYFLRNVAVSKYSVANLVSQQVEYQ